MPLTDHQLCLLGEIAARGVVVEGIAATCIDFLILGRQEVVGDDGEVQHVGLGVLTDGQQAHWLLDRVDRLSDRAGEPVAAEIRAWVRQARDALEERNSLIHSFWFTQIAHLQAAVGIRNRAKGPAMRIVGDQEFQDARDAIAAAQTEGRRLAGVLGGEQ